jgi:hypothetical protein
MSDKNSLKEEILNKIKHDEIKMKSKFHFVFRIAAFVFFLILIFVGIIYFLSFIFFVVFKMNSGSALMGFGFRGIESILSAMPWVLILIVLFFVVIFEVMLTRFKFAYRRPIIYSLLIIIVLFFGLSFCIHHTSFHTNLFMLNKERGLPALGPLYEQYQRMDFKNVYCGIVTAISDTGFEIRWIDNPAVEFEVSVPPDFTKHKTLETGDVVILIGKRNDTVINLIDLTEIESEDFCIHRGDIILK